MYYTCQKSLTICLNQPALRDTIWRPRGRQRRDRDANWGLDKSQHAKQQNTAALGSVRAASWNSFIWSGASIQGSHQESLPSCLQAWRLAGRLSGQLAGRKSLLCGSSSLYGSADPDIWIQFAASTLSQAWRCQGGSQPFDSHSQGPL